MRTLMLIAALFLSSVSMAFDLPEPAELASSYVDRMPAQPVTEEPKYLGFSTPTQRNIQIGLTALMLVDTAQTVTIARNPDCLKEGNPLAAAIYGSDAPSQEQVLVTNAFYITLHWLAARKLDQLARRSDNWNAARKVYQFLTFVGHGAAVANNASLGISPFSNYECSAD